MHKQYNPTLDSKFGKCLFEGIMNEGLEDEI